MATRGTGNTRQGGMGMQDEEEKEERRDEDMGERGKKEEGVSGRAAAGKKGGEATKHNQPPDFFQKIGEKGGKARGERRAA